ncbi:alkylmercury lyase family protein [Kribbella italica]|uniref:tRNA pseudouridine-54 N-methylase n=1 Tax=Kribbella italica TaxID=1540520 RepID=A0A7W9MY68_9ACTN|nr:alkylmercury lyase family protein [Kribbella italica]MBB5840524.1 tRNA pseudouridine-54 N-methylase [Kribbella italica]
MNFEVLHVPDCPNLSPMLQRLAEVTDLPVTTRLIETDADAARYGMAGSPTLLIDGTDPFAGAGDDCACGVSCRLYRDEAGRIVPAPSTAQLRAAITAAGHVGAPAPGEVLSAWRTRAVPLDPVEKAAHQAILRAFAANAVPPSGKDLDALVAESNRTVDDVLTALHEADAIRLDADGQIAVAYPFSATATRHRVHIADSNGGEVDVYAMCAIDALGIAPMLGRDTRIESVDDTTRQPITVTSTSGRTTWQPEQAVVFIGADAGGGPSADCCCDYLNFFTDHDTAQAWASSHPTIPGQILNRADAEDLAARLFHPLLAI